MAVAVLNHFVSCLQFEALFPPVIPSLIFGVHSFHSYFHAVII